jgi:c-di-GMP-binding flagellar brake protein YcgR
MNILYLFLLIIPLLALTAFFMTEKGKGIKEYIRFFTAGLDSGFKPAQILTLGKIGKATGLEDLRSLFWSISALDSCTAEIVRRAKFAGADNDADTQRLLSSLYDYRTKVALDNSHKRRGLESTRDIEAGQRIRILLRGVGVFSSKVLRVTPKDLVLEYPSSTKIKATSIEWKGKELSVYLWRHEDAGYVFDTVVVPDPVSEGRAILHVTHSTNLVRSQKRKSIRVKCSIYAQMYLFKPGMDVDSALEPEPGMKCLLEDISEDGAMVVIGGKAIKDMKIKLQFMVLDVLVIMVGVIRAVEYNQETNQSRIHFECGELNPRMKNAVLTFVYNVLPEEEKEELDAIRLTEEDGTRETEAPDAAQADLGSVEYKPDLPDFAKHS